ncbi:MULTISPECIES: hypothetical protein [Mycobacterium]|uniref:Uncharacterized protein n=1 Tax=Mycobacterium persicum TaxID=1487726 RepID=A0A1X0L6D0_9MYCO|nr:MULTISPECIES: hypothetical protein [Mycobacterium]KZS83864.1 hypothetical protein A4G31_05910 [Mycobacterium persicum]MCQ4364554.1 hypothetical protein [Mycobacterium gordonae]ORB45101.1 hypothetical protein BST40_19650 [Mycobacterium persicum]ORB88873.1 hypothetical protein B1T49_05975 [Mycobacterium persicum]ORB94249.1 hypothetical protein B1T44_06610 [Mycobacterium persicum]
MTTPQSEVQQLRDELVTRLDRQPFYACSPELLRALIAVFDLYAGSPPPPPRPPGFRPYRVK